MARPSSKTPAFIAVACIAAVLVLAYAGRTTTRVIAKAPSPGLPVDAYVFEEIRQDNGQRGYRICLLRRRAWQSPSSLSAGRPYAYITGVDPNQIHLRWINSMSLSVEYPRGAPANLYQPVYFLTNATFRTLPGADSTRAEFVAIQLHPQDRVGQGKQLEGGSP